MTTFNLPDLGEGLAEAEIVAWHVKVGDRVKVDQPMVSVETAKAVVEVPSPYSGVIRALHAAAGEMVATGKPLVDFDIEGAVSVVKSPEPAKPRRHRGRPHADERRGTRRACGCGRRACGSA
jgi:2-oxoisovalerate dehydrogenase E2 component (dihydrolipoyl transacylase)